jgi:hypothetical protein
LSTSSPSGGLSVVLFARAVSSNGAPCRFLGRRQLWEKPQVGSIRIEMEADAQRGSAIRSNRLLPLIARNAREMTSLNSYIFVQNQDVA